MSTDEDAVPRSLVAAFNEAFAKGQYGTGSLEDFISVQYLIFRTNWSAGGSGRLPPSKSKWLDQIRAVEDVGKN